MTLANLLGLLLGFALLADHFERSGVPALLPRFLPDDWKGGFCLLLIVFVLSSFLDNIAAAMIGGTMAAVLYKRRVHIGFLAAIVAASNAGGSGSVVGDTTTTMMWIAGVPAIQVFDAYVAAVTATLIFGVFAARQQHALQPIMKDNPGGTDFEAPRLAIVAIILLSAIGANVFFNLRDPAVLSHWPVIGVAVWVAIVVTGAMAAPDLEPAARGAARKHLSSVAGAVRGDDAGAASARRHPGKAPSAWASSAPCSTIFPSRRWRCGKAAIDWGFLAYAVGFGGSMIWFGSSAGVALSNMYPEAGRSAPG